MVTKQVGQKEDVQSPLSEKRQAFLHMEEMKKNYPFPKDYDYEQVRREAMEEKYGIRFGFPMRESECG